MSEKRQKLSTADLESHLADQLDFLKSSAQSFDNGFEGEAKRLAVAIRILLYDGGSSKSLLGQLGRKAIDFVDTALPLPPTIQPGYSALVMQELSPRSLGYFAALDETPMRQLIPFDQWWNALVLSSQAEGALTRKDLILISANQDGGAHVDSSLDRRYVNLSRENGLNWHLSTPAGMIPLGDPTRPSIRQIAHEVLATLIPGYALKPPKKEGLVFAATMSAGDTSVYAKSGPAVSSAPTITHEIHHAARSAPCPCGSGKKFKRCHGAAAK
jgi:hypothetical protein